MQLLPALTIILPLVGAGTTLVLSFLSRVRPYTRYVALTAVALTTILVLVLGWMESVVFVPSLWQPSLLFGATLALQGDASLQPLALALALVTLSTFLMDLSRAEESNPRLMAVSQALLAAFLLTLWSANLLTTLVSWALYDLLQTAGYLAGEGSMRMAVRSLVLGSLATLLLWGGALLSSGGVGSELWSLMTLGDARMTLWTAAGILRLWAYPFHLAAPRDPGTVPSLTVLLALGPIVGWGLWLRLALANGGFIPGGTWVPILGAVNLAVGGFLAWCCESPRRALSWMGMGGSGLILLAAWLAGESAAGVVAAGSVAWVLGLGLMSLGGGLQRDAPWWTIPALVGALALLGLPLTLGFVPVANLIGGLTGEGRLGWGGAFFLGNLFLIPSLVRCLLVSPSFPLSNHHWPKVARGVGLGLPSLLLVVAGLYPPLLTDSVLVPQVGQLLKMPRLVGWLLWAVSLAGGGVLAWQDAALCAKMELFLGAIHDLLSLEWLYSALVGALERGFRVFRAADKVVGGRGALLWSWLLFLLLLLIWSGR